MKYSDIISINSYFQDVFDIVSEEGDYWKSFIPNNKFDGMLKSVITCLVNPEVKKRKSIWIQGTYGTGKSHATSVIKHILSDSFGEVEEYLNNHKNHQLKAEVLNFRKNNKVFPVLLKGVYNITDNKDLDFVLQNQVKRALKDSGISLNTKSDFELIIDMLNDPDFDDFWKRVIKSNQELSMQLNSAQDLIPYMEQGNHEMLKKVHELLKEKKMFVAYKSITDWLEEVLKELVSKNKANSLMIFWDEATALIDSSERKVILNQLQNIAELSKKGIYLYIVSHKKLDVIESYKELKEDEKNQAKDRFEIEDYSMQPITTYHIISGALKKSDPEKWLELKNRFIENNPSIGDIINKLTSIEGVEVKEKIKDIFPIHPYTAYLATFVSRNIGSTERSIFKFLNDKELGFIKYIENDIENNELLTANYIWDFFLEDFNKDTTGRFSAVIDKFGIHESILDEKGNEYIAVFKVALLLNILYKITITANNNPEKNLVIPHENNIKSAFVGTGIYNNVNAILEYFDNNQIVHRSPEGLYEVAFSALPSHKVEEQKRKELLSYEDITSVLNNFGAKKLELSNQIKQGILRETEINFYWAGEIESSLRKKIESGFKKPYAIHIAVLLLRGKTPVLDDLIGKEEKSKSIVIEAIKKLAEEEEFSNSIFLLINEEFGNKRLERLAENIANYNVSNTLNLQNEANLYLNRSEQYISDWINTIKSGEVDVIFNGQTYKKAFSVIAKYLNEDISKKIFRYGLDNMSSLAVTTVWSTAKSEKAVEHFTFADSRDDLLEKLSKSSQFKTLSNILKNSSGEFIITNNLKLRDDVDTEHPTYKVYSKVKEVLEKQKGKTTFNLGTELAFLHRPPYGLYTNMVNMALTGYALRDFIGNVYEESTGKLVEKDLMRDKVLSLFDYWQSGDDKEKLNLRFSTEEEKKLLEKLKSIFKLDSTDGLNNVKWKIREQFVEKYKCPLWALKYSADLVSDNLQKALDELFKFTVSLDTEIGQTEINKLLDIIENNIIDILQITKKENASNSFNEYLKAIEDIEIQEEEIGSIFDHLSTCMQEELSFWKEDDVKYKVVLWKIKQQSEKKKQNDAGNGASGGYGGNGYNGGNGSAFDPSNGYTTGEGNTASDSDRVEKKNRVINKVKGYNGSVETLKEKFVKLLEEHTELLDTIDGLFE
ncbi:MAG: hypothetical protein ACOZCL_18035 [Bacillota bacterium]